MGKNFQIKLLVPNNFGPQIFSSQKIFVQKITVIKKNCLRKFGWEKLLVQGDVSTKTKKNDLMKTKNWVKRFGQENFVKKNVGQKSLVKKMLVQQKFWSQTFFWSEKICGLKQF